MTEHLHLVVPPSRLDDADYCRRQARKHRDRHLGLSQMAEHETDPEGLKHWRNEAADSLRYAEWWEARAALAEEKING